jgi:exosortase
MTTATAPDARSVLTVLPASTPRRLRRTPAAPPVTGLLLAVVALSAVAFHLSLSSLLHDWQYDSPLADLVLVPVVFVGLAVSAVRRHPYVATVRLGRLDVVVSAVCVALVVAALVVAPVGMGNYYWALRPDLLALPLLVAAGVALLLGTRSLIALLFPLGFLLLAWPLPFQVVLDRLQAPLTAATGQAVRGALHVLPLGGSVLPGGGDVQVQVGSFVLSVASACSGITGIVGLLVVGGAGLSLLAGPVRRRLLWLGCGLVAAWVLNVVRIVALVAVGSAAGERTAMDVLHPVAGLLLLNLLLIAMVLALPRFGLALRPLREKLVSDVPLTSPQSGPEGRGRRGRRTAVLAVVALGVALLDSGLGASAAAFDNSGRPAAVAFSSREVAGPGVRITGQTQNDWSKPYFGADSLWRRYVLQPQSRGSYTVWLDSIVTSDLAALRAHPVAGCYRFHGFATPVSMRVVLAQGVVAQRFVYTRPDGAQWHTLSWQWPVTTGQGEVRQERVVLLASSLREAPAAVSPEGRLPGVPVRDTLAAILDRGAPDHDANPALTAALVARADALIPTHLSSSGAPA